MPNKKAKKGESKKMSISVIHVFGYDEDEIKTPPTPDVFPWNKYCVGCCILTTCRHKYKKEKKCDRKPAYIGRRETDDT